MLILQLDISPIDDSPVVVVDLDHLPMLAAWSAALEQLEDRASIPSIDCATNRAKELRDGDEARSPVAAGLHIVRGSSKQSHHVQPKA